MEWLGTSLKRLDDRQEMGARCLRVMKFSKGREDRGPRVGVKGGFQRGRVLSTRRRKMVFGVKWGVQKEELWSSDGRQSSLAEGMG